MSIPNILTTFRVILIPVFTWLMLGERNLPAAASVFVLSGVTDFLDGYIARKYNMITDVGKVYDPLADKLTQVTAVVCLYWLKLLPAWVLLLIVVKEAAMVIIGLCMYVRKIVTYSDWYGKAATVLFYAVVFVIIFTGGGSSEPYGAYPIILGICAVFPGVGYLIRLFKKRNGKNDEQRITQDI